MREILRKRRLRVWPSNAENVDTIRDYNDNMSPHPIFGSVTLWHAAFLDLMRQICVCQIWIIMWIQYNLITDTASDIFFVNEIISEFLPRTHIWPTQTMFSKSSLSVCSCGWIILVVTNRSLRAESLFSSSSNTLTSFPILV